MKVLLKPKSLAGSFFQWIRKQKHHPHNWRKDIFIVMIFMTIK
jgi:hypothetical protein